MREPWFWRSDALAARVAAGALAPLALAYDAGQRLRRAAAAPAEAPGPVICIGNATLGGVGKTPFAILVSRILRQAGRAPWFLTRGYGGRLKGPVRIAPERHGAEDVGDEALLLAQHGPVILSADRPRGARAAFEGGADTVIMDDGYQNPTLRKTLSILLVDAADPAGNGRVFPSGPLREPLARARARADMVVAVKRRADDPAPAGLDADFQARLAPAGDVAPRRVVAFTGIGVPAKFFTTLADAGFELSQQVPFADHHVFSRHEMKALRRAAKENKAALITTEKDYARLPDAMRKEILTLPVAMALNDEAGFRARLLAAIGGPGGAPPNAPIDAHKEAR